MSDFALPASFLRVHAPFTLLDFEVAAPASGLVIEDHEAEAFLRAKKLLPFAVGIEGFLCFDASFARDDADWPVRSYAPRYFHEGNPDFYEWTDETTVGPIVARSFASLVAFHERVSRADDASWGDLGAPEGADDDDARAFWVGAVRRHVVRTVDARTWRRLPAVLGPGLRTQLHLYPMAQHALAKDPEIAHAIGRELTAPELRVQGRILCARALAALGRHAENEAGVFALAREWIGPAAPLSANQLLTRDEVLELLRPYRSLGARVMRVRVALRATPEVAM